MVESCFPALFVQSSARYPGREGITYLSIRTGTTVDCLLQLHHMAKPNCHPGGKSRHGQAHGWRMQGTQNGPTILQLRRKPVPLVCLGFASPLPLMESGPRVSATPAASHQPVPKVTLYSKFPHLLPPSGVKTPPDDFLYGASGQGFNDNWRGSAMPRHGSGFIQTAKRSGAAPGEPSGESVILSFSLSPIQVWPN